MAPCSWTPVSEWKQSVLQLHKVAVCKDADNGWYRLRTKSPEPRGAEVTPNVKNKAPKIREAEDWSLDNMMLFCCKTLCFTDFSFECIFHFSCAQLNTVYIRRIDIPAGKHCKTLNPENWSTWCNEGVITSAGGNLLMDVWFQSVPQSILTLSWTTLTCQVRRA